MKKTFLFVIAALTILCIASCSNSTQQNTGTTTPSAGSQAGSNKDTVVLSQGTNRKGIGRFKDVPLTHPLDEAMASKGQTIYEAKCFACHKLTDEKLVGPGWKGITDRRLPEWIMNFITNTQVMLDKDLAAQALMVTCVVRMPDENLSDDEARQVLEFMRKNDGKN